MEVVPRQPFHVVFAALVGLFVATAGVAGVVVPSVTLTEVRIDQSSTDNDEYFELAGSPSDSLTGLTYLVIGDGTGGSGVIEAVVDLSGQTIQSSGFFVAAEGTFTLGSADMTTSLNFENSDNVTHLLVADFSGANGDDLDTYDDGVLDVTPWSSVVDCVGLVETVGSGDQIYCPTTVGPDGSFVPGHAFLCPSGWQIGAFDPVGGNDTPGAVNDCTAAAGDLVINEIDYDQSGTDVAEFIEIKNVDAVDVDLTGFSLELVNGSGGGASVYDTIVLPSVSLAPGDYFVVCGDAADVFQCDLDATPDSNLIQNGAPDAVALIFGGAIVDSVSYEGDTGAPYTEGSGSGLTDSSGIDNGGISRFPDGVDTDVNNVDLSFRCITPGSPNSAASSSCPPPGPPPGLVINEVDADTPGSDTLEFVELYDGGVGNSVLDGLVIVFFNGNGDVAYDALDLDGFVTDANGYFVYGNAAVSPDVVLPDNGLQNGADAVALYVGDASDFPVGTPVSTADLVDALVYDTADADDAGLLALLNAGQPQVDEGGAGDKDNHSNQRCPNGIGGRRNTDTYLQDVATPDAINSCPPLEIFTIQGSGATSPFDGFTVTTEDNVVTTLAPDGFFMQTPTARSDGDVDTSDGIFVFTGGPPAVAVGDLVDVTGTVDEFFLFTELSFGAIVTVVGADVVPAPVTFDATVPSPDPNFSSCAIEYECYEGMLIEIADGTVTGPNQRFGTDPIAEVFITAAPARTFREPGIEFPGLVGLPVWDGNPEVFELDPDKLGLPNQIIPAGSAFSALGVLGFEFGGYELWPSQLTVAPAPLPVPVRPRDPGELTVGSLNLFRLFDDVDDPPDGDRDDFVVSTAEYERRLAKFSAYIRDVLDSPDILAVQEVESLVVLEDLAAEILADSGLSVDYSAWLIEGHDVGTIDVGFLTRASIQVDGVTQVDPDATFVNPITLEDDILHDRPPLVLEGQYELGLASFPITVMAVHNRSLSDIDGSEGLRVRKKRFLQAVSIADEVAARQTADPDLSLVVTGDFNAFEFTDGYVDAVGVITGDFVPGDNLVCDDEDCTGLPDVDLFDEALGLPAAERYSFIFGGTAQVLDHALTSLALHSWVTGMEYGRGNADAAVDLINDDGTVVPANLPLRSSDHDGLVLFVAPGPDLQLAKSDGGVIGTPGSTLSYTLDVNNVGIAQATGVVLTETVPGNTVAGTNPGWEVAPLGSAIPCDLQPAGTFCVRSLGSLPSGSTSQVTFEVVVDNPLPPGVDSLFNQASIADDGSHGPDLYPSDNISSSMTAVGAAPDLMITKGDGGLVAIPGQVIPYTLSYYNFGNQGATGVLVTDTVPSSTRFDQAGSGGPGVWSCNDGDPAGSVCTHLVGGLPGGGLGTGMVTFAVRVDDPLAVGITEIDNTASIADDLANGTDLDPLDNVDSETTPLDLTAPTVTRLESTASTGDPAVSELEECETAQVAVTALHVTFSEPVRDPAGNSDPDDVTNPSNFLLVEPGVDLDYQTTGCALGLAGDDVAIPVVAVSYSEASNTATLDFGGVALADSIYRLFVCGSTTIRDLPGNRLDGNGDGSGGDDFARTFRVDRFNLLDNGHFDCSLAQWVLVSTDPGEITYASDDVDGSPLSGSADVENLTASSHFAIGQCIEVVAETDYELSGKIRLDAPSDALIGVTPWCEMFDAAGCAGSSLAVFGDSVVAGPTLGQWVDTESDFRTPSAAESALCSFSLQTPTGVPFEAQLDALRMEAVALIFEDGFESGDTTQWSSTEGE